MKVFVTPKGLHSPAMVRIADAISKHRPEGVAIVPDEEGADVCVLYVIGRDYVDRARLLRSVGKRYVVVQCCLRTAGFHGQHDEGWYGLWRDSEFVWTYYDMHELSEAIGFRLYCSPLGVDSAFTPHLDITRDRLVITTGCVAGPSAEAIEEVWTAANILGISALHIGPDKVVGMGQPPGWRSTHGISDAELVVAYSRAMWVAALRHTEGFELPAAEGLACGACPILFDQWPTRRWYGNSAMYVEDRSGASLIKDLVITMSRDPVVHRDADLSGFDWSTICAGFWANLLEVSK